MVIDDIPIPMPYTHTTGIPIGESPYPRQPWENLLLSFLYAIEISNQ